MPLHIMTTEVENEEETCYLHDEDGKRTEMEPITKYLGFSAMWCGWSSITAENLNEVWARVSYYEKLFGASLSCDGEPRPFTREDLEKRVGLTTNCNVEPYARWVARMGKRYAQEVSA